jgi:hypothetical protein
VPDGLQQPKLRAMRDTETLDSELRLAAALRRAVRQRGGPLQSVVVADALLNGRRELKSGLPRCHGNVHDFGCE